MYTITKNALKVILKPLIQKNDKFRECFLINESYLEIDQPLIPTKSKIEVNDVCFEFDEDNKLTKFYGIW